MAPLKGPAPNFEEYPPGIITARAASANNVVQASHLRITIGRGLDQVYTDWGQKVA
jgi:hypothetical protein